MPSISWPNGKHFAFTIIDDNDNATVQNNKPVYDLLYTLGMKTTKTVWVYEPRDKFSGGCLVQDEYNAFIKSLREKGFEIVLHNVGSGSFERDEILTGLEIFKEKMGYYPYIQINHSSNPDNIYWGSKRYCPPVKQLISAFYGHKRHFFGDEEKSKYFWGDFCKQNVKYIRNNSYNGINTFKYDPYMPYKDRKKEKYSNYWFSSSDGADLKKFRDLIAYSNVDSLEEEGGCCIVYTHFASGFTDPSGRIDPEFQKRLEYLASKEGWFVPAGEILDYLLANKPAEEYPPSYSLMLNDLKWAGQKFISKISYRNQG